MEPAIIEQDGAQARLYYGINVIEGLRLLPDESVHCVATSPPYWGLRDYGGEPQIWSGDSDCDHQWHNDGNCLKCTAWKGHLGLEPTPEMYVEHLTEVFAEVRRVLHPQGVVWLNIGDTYMSAPAKNNIDKMGGLQGEKIRNLKGYKESLALHHRPRPQDVGLKYKDLVGIPWRVALGLQQDGWWLRSDAIWWSTNKMPSRARDRPLGGHEYVFLLSKNETYFFDRDSLMEEGFPKEFKKTVWKIPKSVYRGAHFAVWPRKLAQVCVLQGSSSKGCCPVCKAPWSRSRKKGQRRVWVQGCDCSESLPEPCTVLDPFSGSATTGMVALKSGRHYIGLDLQSDYLSTALNRFEGVAEKARIRKVGSKGKVSGNNLIEMLNGED